MASDAADSRRFMFPANVREEGPGVPWNPKGGEFVVLSFLPDDYDGRIEAGTGPEEEDSITEGISNNAEAAAMPVVAFSMAEVENSGVGDVLGLVKMLRSSQEKKQAFFGAVRTLHIRRDAPALDESSWKGEAKDASD